MCGIFGIVTKNEQNLGPILIEAARRLTYRGYDSVGAATLSGGRIDLRKDVGRVDDGGLQIQFCRDERGAAHHATALGHLRRAFAGQLPAASRFGRRPGRSNNGNVVNNVELRQQFMAEGMTVRSQNDGESCVHAVERYIHKGYEFIDAIRLAYGDLQGDYAFVIGRVNDDKLYAIKKGSGLVVGLGEVHLPLFGPAIHPAPDPKNRPHPGREIITLWADRVELRSVKDGKVIARRRKPSPSRMDAVQKGGYPHFMLKEIHEQAQVAREVLHMLEGSPEVRTVLEKMRTARNLYFIGCGTSYHACWREPSILRRSRTGCHPGAGPQFNPAVRSRGQPRGCGPVRQPVGRDQGRPQRPAGGGGARHDRLRHGKCDRLHPDKSYSRWIHCAAVRDQCPGHQDLYQPGGHLPIPGNPPGRKGNRRAGKIPDLMDKTLEMVTPQVEAITPLVNSGRPVLPGLRRDLPDRAGRGTEAEGNHLRPLRGMLSTEFKHGPLSAVSKDYPCFSRPGRRTYRSS